MQQYVLTRVFTEPSALGALACFRQARNKGSSYCPLTEFNAPACNSSLRGDQLLTEL
jgi:hypothetical protein